MHIAPNQKHPGMGLGTHHFSLWCYFSTFAPHNSGLEKLVFFHVANVSFLVNDLKFQLVLPLTGMPVGKTRRASPSICVTFEHRDSTLPPVSHSQLCYTSSSPHTLAGLQGIMDVHPHTYHHLVSSFSPREWEVCQEGASTTNWMFNSTLANSLIPICRLCRGRQVWILPILLLISFCFFLGKERKG